MAAISRASFATLPRARKPIKKLSLYTRALERSNKELDEFAYIASHDLKEPLRGIHNHSRFLLEDNEDKLDEDSVGRLKRLTYLSQRMERLVNDLLYFSRIGRQELCCRSHRSERRDRGHRSHARDVPGRTQRADFGSATAPGRHLRQGPRWQRSFAT